MRYLSSLIHGESGAGKSRLAYTAPGPRLLLDAEGGSAEWAPEPKVVWDPRQPLPQTHDDGSEITTATTVVVYVKDWSTVEACYRVLASGQHYFESAIWDSVTEIQDKCKRALIDATGGMTEARWGTLFDSMAEAVKSWRDLRLPPNPKPIHTVFTAISHDKDGKRWKADVQGALIRKLPGYVDLVGFLSVVPNANASIDRVLAIVALGPYDAKDRTDVLTQRFGNAIVNPDFHTICGVLNGEI